MDEIIRETTIYNIDKMVGVGTPNFKSGSLTIKSLPKREYRWIVGD